MYVQYSEGLPCLTVDRDRERIYFDTGRDVMAEMEAFYAGVIEGDLNRFAISEEYAPGFYRLIEALSGKAHDSLACVKGQVVGPISFGLTVTDQNKKAVLYHDELMDAALKSISMKAAWQVRELKKVCPQVMIWLDEPYLASFGSAYVSLSANQVLSCIGEVVQSIHAAGALAGIHCCGNTDWSLLMNTELDIINFDAYDYFKGMTLYPEALKEFLERGRLLALGIVPTSDRIENETVESLSAKLDERLRILSAKTGLGVDAIWQRCLLTPSCGTGTLSEELAHKVLETVGRIKMPMRAEI
jgi:methionine synthase II (cobalamin-independent)